MYIEVNGESYELNTKLKTSRRIEQRFKIPLIQLFPKLSEALTGELIDIISIAADIPDGEVKREFVRALGEHWDYAELQMAVQELIARLNFSGTDEEVERKLQRYPLPEEQKDPFRKLLGLPPRGTSQD